MLEISGKSNIKLLQHLNYSFKLFKSFKLFNIYIKLAKVSLRPFRSESMLIVYFNSDFKIMQASIVVSKVSDQFLLPVGWFIQRLNFNTINDGYTLIHLKLAFSCFIFLVSGHNKGRDD